MVRIFAKVNEVIGAKLLFAGDGPERYACEQLARSLGICNKVIFLGKVRDTAHVLSLADLFLLPSETESFGLAALEAMAVGVPVISSNTGGIPEVNVHGETGYLSDVGNIDEMAENALRILSDDTVLNQFKEKALERSHVFSLEKILPMYEKIYTDLVEEYQAKKLLEQE